MKKTLKLIPLFTCLTLITGCVYHVGGNRDNHTANVTLNETLELDATALSQLNIDAGAGYLNIIGSDTNTIMVEAKIRTDEERRYTLTLKKSGNQAMLVAEQKSYGSWSGSSPYIDLTVTVPKTLALDIDDGSGDISISRINNSITLDDGSGSIEISKINGEIHLQDGSGWITLENINGNINVEDGSDDLTISNTSGNIYIDDGSGQLTVLNTSGKVTVDDGSGDITIENAGGLNIIESGSGGLKVSNISGQMNIGS